MSVIAAEPSLEFPWKAAPAIGEPVEVAPGILWLRLKLPYALNHVNLYLFEDAEGWALFDTGLATEETIETWARVLAGPLGGKPIVKLVVSHFHPDHVGMAGWLLERFDMPLYMSQAEYLYSRMLHSLPAEMRREDPAFYTAVGLTPEGVDQVLERGKNYLSRTTGVGAQYRRLTAGDRLRLGDRDWEVLTGGGHAPEQVMLWCEADRLFLSADQVLAKISPNVSVIEIEPDADPLGIYLASLDALAGGIDDGDLVLPCHNLPFRGLATRVRELRSHHAHRCDLIAAACRGTALSCAELVPVMFERTLDPHQLSFAVGEALAHLNYMVKRQRLDVEWTGGVARYRAG